MSFTNTPTITTLPTTNPEIINATLSTSLGIQEIANFQFSLDKLVLNLNGASNTVLRAADNACYRAKRLGRNQWRDADADAGQAAGGVVQSAA